MLTDFYMPLALEELPKYDLFLSQVTDFLNGVFPEEHFTGNIVQNYIKSEVITKPLGGKKRGYTRMHLIQLLFLGYMRPVLTTGEIKQVFRLAFNEINQPEDDIISWEEAYAIFRRIYRDGEEEAQSNLDSYLKDLSVPAESQVAMEKFIQVLILVTKASAIKRSVQAILKDETDPSLY